VIVDDVDVVRVTALPKETNAISLIDPDAVLPLTLALERLQLEAWSAQVTKRSRLV
jgi:hypothetical protein